MVVLCPTAEGKPLQLLAGASSRHCNEHLSIMNIQFQGKIMKFKILISY
jgi:hypothetical protein